MARHAVKMRLREQKRLTMLRGLPGLRCKLSHDPFHAFAGGCHTLAAARRLINQLFEIGGKPRPIGAADSAEQRLLSATFAKSSRAVRVAKCPMPSVVA
jgi:hypothetical protein